MNTGFENARRPGRRRAWNYVAYLFLYYHHTAKRQDKLIKELKLKLKTQRDSLADSILKAIPHTELTCNGTCDSHIIVKYIKNLKDLED